jgi:hypothetical protein
MDWVRPFDPVLTDEGFEKRGLRVAVSCCLHNFVILITQVSEPHRCDEVPVSVRITPYLDQRHKD